MAKMIQKILVGVAIFSCLMACNTQAVMGNIITMGADYEYSGGTAPAGTAPWITATFDDGGGTGSVTMTLSAANLTGPESVELWYFNLDPNLDPGSLTFSTPTKTGTFETPTVSTGINAYMADGDGNYDIQIAFNHTDGDDKRFTVGDSISYNITRAGLTANSFNFLSDPAGGHGPYIMAAHVQNTPNGGGGSGWVTQIPEPSTLVLFGLGLSVLLVSAWRRRK
jgi:hypothetical protein